MKHGHPLLSVIFLCIGLSASAQRPTLTIKSYAQKAGLQKEKYALAQFDGRWQEQSRINSKTNEKVAIEDSFYIRFFDGNKCITKQGDFLPITGSAQIYRGDNITTSANDFKILSISEREMMLDDGMGYLHNFVKTGLFAYEMATAEAASPLAEEKYSIDYSFIKANWYAYRRGAKPGTIGSGTGLIKKLDITEKVDSSTYKAQVEYSIHGNTVSEACTIKLDKDKMMLVAQGNTWDMEIYKCDAKELVVGKKGELVYYFNNGNY